MSGTYTPEYKCSECLETYRVEYVLFMNTTRNVVCCPFCAMSINSHIKNVLKFAQACMRDAAQYVLIACPQCDCEFETGIKGGDSLDKQLLESVAVELELTYGRYNRYDGADARRLISRIREHLKLESQPKNHCHKCGCTIADASHLCTECGEEHRIRMESGHG